jgi:hypothetical protein
MDAKLKAKWIKALRSGEYKQGKTFLYKANEEAYCCLGVLCAINGVSRTKMESECTTDIVWFDSGLAKETRSLLGDVMNDQEGKSFAEIADWIEANL